MKKTDQTYLDNLVIKAQKGSSNAFAELTAAVYRRHYSYLLFMLGSEEKAAITMKRAYQRILDHVASMGNPDLYMPWSCRILYSICEGSEDHKNMNVLLKTPAGNVSLIQLYTLPMAESQVMIMHYKQKLSVKNISNILNYDRSYVKRCISAAVRHLKRIPFEEEAASGKDFVYHGYEDNISSETYDSIHQERDRKPDVVAVQELLDYVFEKCSRKPNTIPVEALSAYAVYRKERFSLQKGVLIAAIILFLLLPLLFIAPDFELSEDPEGERGLPVVSIDVKPGLPVSKVTARINSRNLPVYEAGAFEYSVEPTRNGTLSVRVELINRQGLTREMEMEDVDSHGPELIGSSIEETEVVLKVRDDGIGVDYREIYATDQAGNTYYPMSYDEASGEIVFEYPETELDVYVPDHIGNRLHLSFVFE